LLNSTVDATGPQFVSGLGRFNGAHATFDNTPWTAQVPRFKSKSGSKTPCPNINTSCPMKRLLLQCPSIVLLRESGGNDAWSSLLVATSASSSWPILRSVCEQICCDLPVVSEGDRLLEKQCEHKKGQFSTHFSDLASPIASLKDFIGISSRATSHGEFVSVKNKGVR
jgi:hypothetical protein